MNNEKEENDYDGREKRGCGKKRRGVIYGMKLIGWKMEE